jgi:hypothetical protein
VGRASDGNGEVHRGDHEREEVPRHWVILSARRTPHAARSTQHAARGDQSNVMWCKA